MRIEFSTTTHPSRVAKAIVKSLKAGSDPSIKLSRAQDMAAAMFGYPSWRDLSKAAGRSGQSPWDEAVEAGERHGRRQQYVAALVGCGIDPTHAAAIVDEVRPTSRRLAAVKDGAGWRGRLRSRVDANGFFDVDPDLAAYDWPARFHEGWRNGSGRTREIALALPDGSAATLRIRQSPNMTECGEIRVSEISSALIAGNRLVGVANGYVVTSPDGEMTDDYEFFDACDQIEDDLASAANILGQEYGTDELFEAGDAIFVLFRWAAARGHAPAGTGAAHLRGLLESLRRSYRIASMAVTVHPSQFHDIDFDKRLRTQGFVEASRNLRAYMDGLGLEGAMGEFGRIFHYEEKPGTGGPINDGLLLTGQRMAQAHLAHMEDPEAPRVMTKSLDDMTPEDIEEVARLKPGLAAMLRQATRTDPSEPKPLLPEQWPAGFDWQWAASLRSFDPHPDLWKHMPTDLVSIKVRYRDGEEGRRDVDVVTYRFANETELAVPGSHLIGGADFGKMPEAFTAGNGYPVVVNPYTDKYMVGRLAETLRVNSMLLFAGSRDRPLRWPNEAQRTRHEPLTAAAS